MKNCTDFMTFSIRASYTLLGLGTGETVKPFVPVDLNKVLVCLVIHCQNNKSL